MTHPATMNPLGFIINRQYNDKVNIKNNIFSERLAKARNLYRKDLYAHYGCVNAIEFSNEGELLVSGGDDRRVLLWSIPMAIHGKGTPYIMQTNHISNIFCVAFDSRNTRVFSGGNDDQVIIHDLKTGNMITKMSHRKPVYGLSVHPQDDNLLATAGDDGRIMLFDARDSPNDVQCLAKQKTGFHSVMFNPTNSRFLVTANSEEGIALWDCRKPKEVLVHYDSKRGTISGISACFDDSGKRVLALRRRLPPVLYETQCETSLCQFYHPLYYNSCTMKTCCFAGDNDEYILSGSDDFNLYMWKIPQDEDCEWGTSHVVLKGHRSIVNQVRYSKHNNLIASSGVEKMVKLWSSIPVGTWKGSLLKTHTESPRTIYTQDDYIEIVGRTGERITHDYSDQSTGEDTKMMAFFDSLIQREIEGWDSPSDSSLSTDSDSDTHNQYWNNLISEIYRNGRNTEDLKKNKTNKIIQLIYKKRNSLAKLAHDKSKSALRRYHLKEKSRKRKAANAKLKSSKSHKHNGAHKRSRKRSSGTDKESHRSRPDSSSSSHRKYRTRLSARDAYDSASNNSIDVPSTSTGITNSSTSAVYRVIDQDSEEDVASTTNCVEVEENVVDNVVEENNFINILPTPLNGSHDLYINENGNGSVVSVVSSEDFELASTSSASTRHCSTVEYHSSASTSTNSLHINGNHTYLDSDSESDYEYDYMTPVKKRRTFSASDSGCATGPSSSKAFPKRDLPQSHQACSSNSAFNDCSSDEEYKYEKMKKRIKKARDNIRKRIAVESDSN